MMTEQTILTGNRTGPMGPLGAASRTGTGGKRNIDIAMTTTLNHPIQLNSSVLGGNMSVQSMKLSLHAHVSGSAPSGGDKPRVGIIGVGRMGMPMVGRLREAGYSVHAFARRPEQTDEARSLGATLADSPAQVAREVDILVLCAYSDGQVRDVALGPGGVISEMKPGSILLVHTSCSPTTGDDLIRAAAARGVEVADGPLAGLPSDVAAGTVTVLLGASDKSFETLRAVVCTYADPVIHVGKAGDGHRTKILNCLLMAAHTRLVEEAASLAGHLGLEPAKALRAVTYTGATSGILEQTLSFDEDPSMFASAIRPFLVKDVHEYDDFFETDNTELGLLGTLAHRAAVEDSDERSKAAAQRLQDWALTQAERRGSDRS